MGNEILQRQRVVRQRKERGIRVAEREVGGYVGSCCVRVGSGVKTDATTPSNVGTCSASWEGYGKGKRRNEFVEWHVAWVAEWHNYAECNIRRMTHRNKLNWKVPLFWRQSICKRSRCFKVAGSTYYDNHGHEGSLSISLFSTATKNLSAFISRAAWQHRYQITKVGHWRKDVFKEGYALFYFNFFCKRCLDD